MHPVKSKVQTTLNHNTPTLSHSSGHKNPRNNFREKAESGHQLDHSHPKVSNNYCKKTGKNLFYVWKDSDY